MLDNSIHNMYKRKESDGMFSNFSVNQFGFISDSIYDHKTKAKGEKNKTEII